MLWSRIRALWIYLHQEEEMQSNNRIFTRDDVVFAGPLLNIIFETVRNTLHQTPLLTQYWPRQSYKKHDWDGRKKAWRLPGLHTWMVVTVMRCHGGCHVRHEWRDTTLLRGENSHITLRLTAMATIDRWDTNWERQRPWHRYTMIRKMGLKLDPQSRVGN